MPNKIWKSETDIKMWFCSNKQKKSPYKIIATDSLNQTIKYFLNLLLNIFLFLFFGQVVTVSAEHPSVLDNPMKVAKSAAF